MNKLNYTHLQKLQDALYYELDNSFYRWTLEIAVAKVHNHLKSKGEFRLEFTKDEQVLVNQLLKIK